VATRERRLDRRRRAIDLPRSQANNLAEAFDIPTVAAKLALAEGTVYKLIVSGELFAIATTPHGSRKTWRVPKWALEAYLRGEKPEVARRRKSG
jgi:excisionase family DNA binding protein